MHTKTKQQKIHLLSATGIMLCMILIVNRKQDIYHRWEQSHKRESISHEQVISRLWNKKKCYLCGKNKKSLTRYYRKFDAIGVICLCDWYVLDLGLHESDGQKILADNDQHISFRMTNIGDISIMESSSPDRGMTTMDIYLPQDHKPDIEMLQESLCQDCLNDVMDTLQISKDKIKQTYPLCLVDFQTLEVYPLQDPHTMYSIRDHFVEIEYDEDRIKIKTFYLSTPNEGGIAD